MKQIEITLEQLWEAIDDCYKYVTMDRTGLLSAFQYKPKQNRLVPLWYGGTGRCKDFDDNMFVIKEFAGKDWKECIAERPNKIDFEKVVGKFVITKSCSRPQFVTANYHDDDDKVTDIVVNDARIPISDVVRVATAEDILCYLYNGE